MLDLLTADPERGSGFSWTNLLILVVIVAVLWPLIRVARRAAAKHRARQRAEEDAAQGRETFFTEDNDPDLRRDPPTDH